MKGSAALSVMFAVVSIIFTVIAWSAEAHAIPIAGNARQAPAEATKPRQCRTVIRYSSERQIIHTKDGRTLPLVVLRPVFKRVCW